ncbi:hypothetical protein [Bacillus cytotoxicus]|uniref:hypothetical protein n=1 Tax=Bacillus cytotoxicus TaxID=580165 RepID=UPI0008646603|nr:hypothetical protein [Bacillus cytotoxicus]AWC27966.1 hypothetical protein CG483_006040 [Bacillus cytotoxicus]AWC40652.1 hypothetical protein CG480_009215 [Bacillus cytotoxicus]AWC48583.1 hypothetical protein CG478_009215 [Bacillus cytotoxicus]AWC56166.1 hypothetical protein CG476_006030 [Bacillus cytotoxicus]MDH2859333.1 hypothetical protein [Bacillus cytotoxicus]
MNRLTLKKLIVISESEKRSREIEFKEGLNIIIGKNKTGKSSLIKSIFFTFGCEVKFEDEWKKLIDKYLLYFQYGNRYFCILRINKSYKIFETNQEFTSYQLIIETDSFHDYSKELMKLLGISMDCLTKSGNPITITPPLLFRFQYIDQDKGWEKIGQSFTNMQYIKDWDSNTNKYVVGFLNEEFYKTKRDRDIIKTDIVNYDIKINHFEEFIKNLSASINKSNTEDTFDKDDNNRYSNNKELNQSLVNKMDSIEKEILELVEKLSKIKNKRYEKTLELNFIKENVKELEADHTFAIHEDPNLKCPFCGSVHENSLENRIEIVKDIQTGSELVALFRSEIKELDSKIHKLSTRKKQLTLNYKSLKKNVEQVKENVSIIKSYQDQGKIEMIDSSIKQKEEIISARDTKNSQKLILDDQLNQLKSPQRRNLISQALKSYCMTVYDILNIPSSFIKLRDFVQTLQKTGSDNPRMIYAYHISLYLYNLNREHSPFNFLVIDTPNQQGQDEENLKSIDSALSLLTSKNGQVIIGTERETGHEENASKVTYLIEERRCLTSINYKEHIDLLHSLL